MAILPHINDDNGRLLYHGTLRRNIPSIRASGLKPQKGPWARRFHPDPAALVNAVDEEHRSAAILAIVGQMAKADLATRSQSYSFDNFKKDLVAHGAIIVVKATNFRSHAWAEEPGHPLGVEQGNWYSSEITRLEKAIVGPEMLSWLKPHEQDFYYRYSADEVWNWD